MTLEQEHEIMKHTEALKSSHSDPEFHDACIFIATKRDTTATTALKTSEEVVRKAEADEVLATLKTRRAIAAHIKASDEKKLSSELLLRAESDKKKIVGEQLVRDIIIMSYGNKTVAQSYLHKTIALQSISCLLFWNNVIRQTPWIITVNGRIMTIVEEHCTNLYMMKSLEETFKYCRLVGETNHRGQHHTKCTSYSKPRTHFDNLLNLRKTRPIGEYMVPIGRFSNEQCSLRKCRQTPDTTTFSFITMMTFYMTVLSDRDLMVCIKQNKATRLFRVCVIIDSYTADIGDKECFKKLADVICKRIRWIQYRLNIDVAFRNYIVKKMRDAVTEYRDGIPQVMKYQDVNGKTIHTLLEECRTTAYFNDICNM
jgi:hypothetical protein